VFVKKRARKRKTEGTASGWERGRESGQTNEEKRKRAMHHEPADSVAECGIREINFPALGQIAQ
jgi:hypothetical protein